MNPAKEIGSLIKDRRKAKKLSQKELALNIFGAENRADAICRIEKGDWERTRFITITSILKVLDIDLIALIKNL